MISKVAFLPLATPRGRAYDSIEPRYGSKETEMLKLGLFARLEAKPGKENEVVEFLKD